MKQYESKYKETVPIGTMCLCNWGGLEVLDILHGINDYVIACFNYGNGRRNFGKHKIEYTRGDKPYFRKLGSRYYLDDIMEV